MNFGILTPFENHIFIEYHIPGRALSIVLYCSQAWFSIEKISNFSSSNYLNQISTAHNEVIRDYFRFLFSHKHTSSLQRFGQHVEKIFLYSDPQSFHISPPTLHLFI